MAENGIEMIGNFTELESTEPPGLEKEFVVVVCRCIRPPRTSLVAQRDLPWSVEGVSDMSTFYISMTIYIMRHLRKRLIA